MTQRTIKIIAIVIVLLAGCPVSHPTPRTGMAWIYDGVEFRSNSSGEPFNDANFDRSGPYDVELVFPDGFAIHPLKLTPDIAREHAEYVDISQDDGKGSFILHVESARYSGLYMRFEGHRPVYVSMGCGSTPDESEVLIRVRGQELSIGMLKGSELQEKLGEPDTVENFVPATNPH